MYKNIFLRDEKVPVMRSFLFIESITCIKQRYITGKDFIYIQVVWGKPGITLIGFMGAGETKQLQRSIILPNRPCRLELWEKDTIATNDKIGIIDLQHCNREVSQEVIFKNRSTCYKMGFRLVMKT
jgi:hypothetical protein